MNVSRSDEDSAPAAISIERLDPPILEALLRLIEALDDPQLLPYLAPLIQQEIIFRLLLGRHGSHLRKLVVAETPSQQIARVVAWIKQNFTEAIRLDEFAAKANMSPSTFRQHFHAITRMSPLQFQKQLRLHEARQLMLNQNMDAGQAAIVVGTKAPRSLAANTIACSALRLTAMSGACGRMENTRNKQLPTRVRPNTLLGRMRRNGGVLGKNFVRTGKLRS